MKHQIGDRQLEIWALRLVVTGLINILFLIPIYGRNFNEVPVYGTGTGWPTVAQYEQMIEDFTWCHNAIEERMLSAKNCIIDCPVMNGIVRPYSSVDDFKGHISMVLGSSFYVDDTRENDFADYADFPKLSATGLVQRLSLRADFLATTPSRGIQVDVNNLKAATKALRWIEYESSSFTNSQSRYAVGFATNNFQYHETWQDACHRHIEAWNDAPWRDGGGSHWAFAQVQISIGQGMTNFTVSGGRGREKPEICNIPTNRPCSADIYYVHDHWIFDQEVFKDIDSLGIQDEKLWFSGISLPESKDERRVGGFVGDSDVSPVEASGLGEGPYDASTNSSRIYYLQSKGYGRFQDNYISHWLLKWNFEYK